ncbi:MAG: hypothetical protein ACE5Q3_08195 [Alphaproteobacteria bacterium]
MALTFFYEYFEVAISTLLQAAGMRIVNETDNGYDVICKCGHGFRTGRLSLTFECPSCGAAAYAADLVTDWVLGRNRVPQQSPASL